MAGDKYANIKLYNYDPSRVAALVSAALFLVSTLVHVYFMTRHRTWYWTPFVIGGTFEVLGYIFRSISSSDTTALSPYIGQSLLLLLAPALYAASIYMVLSRLIAMLPNGQKYSLVRCNWLTKIFVGGDVFSFLLQSTGGAMLGTAKGDADKQKMGEHLIVGGLFLQLVFFGFFIIVSVIFWRRYRNEPISGDKDAVETKWRTILKVLIGASKLIFMRCTFRVVEYLGGHDGFLLSKEIFLYIFDATLMFLVSVIFNVWFPGKLVKVVKGEYGMGRMGSA